MERQEGQTEREGARKKSTTGVGEDRKVKDRQRD